MGKKILVIGNDLYTEALLIRAFSHSDSQVLLISEHGKSMLPSGLIRPDLVILDSPVRGAPDWDILRQLRLLLPVPIIVLTDVEDIQVRIKCFNLGADYRRASRSTWAKSRPLSAPFSDWQVENECPSLA